MIKLNPVKLRIPVPPPSQRHKSAKDYKRLKLKPRDLVKFEGLEKAKD